LPRALNEAPGAIFILLFFHRIVLPRFPVQTHQQFKKTTSALPLAANTSKKLILAICGVPEPSKAQFWGFFCLFFKKTVVPRGNPYYFLAIS
jgi:hypothetical protein